MDDSWLLITASVFFDVDREQLRLGGSGHDGGVRSVMGVRAARVIYCDDSAAIRGVIQGCAKHDVLTKGQGYPVRGSR